MSDSEKVAVCTVDAMKARLPAPRGRHEGSCSGVSCAASGRQGSPRFARRRLAWETMLSIMADMRALPSYPPRSVRLGGCPIYNAEGLRDQRFRVVQPPRNFGHQPAITAGMRAAYGRAVIVMDAGFQDPPHVILEMAAKLFCNLLRRIAEIDQPIDVGDFRLVDRKALDAFLQMRKVAATSVVCSPGSSDFLLPRCGWHRRLDCS